MEKKRKIFTIIYHLLVCGFGLVMIYPLIWMVVSSFKETNTIFTTAGSPIPQNAVVENYINGWKGFAGVTFARFFGNSLFITILSTIGTVASSACVAYAFARCKFPGKKILFTAMLASMMIPGQILMVPQYLWYQKLGWVGSYLPLIVPFCFAIQGFFIYLMMSFIQGIPKELDEAAYIDGCSSLKVYFQILLPLIKPALFSAGLFQFMWTWNDFFNTLIYISSVKKFPVSLGLRASLDTAAQVQWDKVMAMSMISILPLIILFFFAQKYFVEGISTTGLKG